jgi:DNA recombination protein RmuC
LRDRIQDFQKKVETVYDSETRERLSLKEQIRLVVETSSAIGTQADGLAKALRGDSQLRGRWGELALERILEAEEARCQCRFIDAVTWTAPSMCLKSRAWLVKTTLKP